jgi:DNA invertase Pin-like site-specific DNA recombinase
MVGNVSDSIHAESAAAWVRGHASKTRSGMQKKKKEGVHVGRPPKVLSAAERALVTKLRAAGKGWRTIAHEVSKERGAFDVADPKVSKKRRVSHMLIWRLVTGAPPVTKSNV